MSAGTPPTDETKRVIKLARPVERRPAEPIDLFALAGPSVAARTLPPAAVGAIVGAAAAPQPWLRWTFAAVASGLVVALGRRARAGAGP